MEPTLLTIADQRGHLDRYDAIAEAYHVACEAATIWGDVRAAEDIYWAAYDALTALKGGAR